ncbi:MAG: chromate efflux transporter [Clostridiales bacterium]|nr:chromate efflux transporter [Clostridiales bacterium]
MQSAPYKTLSPPDRKRRLLEVALVFLRLGLVAFGGPAAHIAMMEEELVQKRKWLSREQFLDFMGATNLIPGPNSTEMAIHLGFARGGPLGLLLAGVCFILPAFVSVLVFAVLYQRHGQVREVEGLLYGIKPVVLAVIIQALVRLSKTVIKDVPSAVVVGLAIGLYALGLPEIPLLLLAGVAVMLFRNWPRIRQKLFALPLLPLPLAAALPQALEPAGRLGTAGLFWTFLKIGSFLYGSGYVLLAFLEGEFVSKLGVLNMRQILDAVAVGQFTPGPVFTTATFIGYLLGGPWGAGAATAGIFLPSFVLVFALNPLIPRMRASTWLGALLDGVNAASLALMAAVSLKLGLASLSDGLTIGLFLGALLLLLRFRVNSFWLILGGGLIGLLVKLIW